MISYRDNIKFKQDGALSIVLCFLILLSLSSCNSKQQASQVDFETTPIQIVDSLEIIQSRNGGITMRMTAPRMERYQFEKDSTLQSFESYPDSFFVFGYTADGFLETTITAKGAKHTTTTDAQEWVAYGNVEIINYLHNQKVISDTIYWDQEGQRFYTDCYVRLEGGKDVMQGYGMESDEMARNATILRPFDSYAFIEDSLSKANAPITALDSINMMGPFPKR